MSDNRNMNRRKLRNPWRQHEASGGLSTISEEDDLDWLLPQSLHDAINSDMYGYTVQNYDQRSDTDTDSETINRITRPRATSQGSDISQVAQG